MARKFHLFRKLPLELRRNIWNLAMEPRVIRASRENETYAKGDYKSIYRLNAGPVPKVFLVCHESRLEAKRQYNLVNARLSTNAEEPPHRPNAIWINYDIDTIYFTNWPTMPDFLIWNRKIALKVNNQGPKKIQHIALPASDILEKIANEKIYRLDGLFQLFMEHPNIRHLDIVLDNSNFQKDKATHRYKLRSALVLTPPSRGGRWGNRVVRSNLRRLFKNFFRELKQGETMSQLIKVAVLRIEKWKKWRIRHPEWKEVKFQQKSISKDRPVSTF